MINLEVVQGAQVDRVLQIANPDGTTPTTGDFLGTDALSCVVWAGQSQAPLFAPSIAWYTANSTQTGYDQGQFQITISAAQSATLDAAGVYQLQAFATRSGSRGCVAWTTLSCLPSAGTGTQSIATYCDDSDLLFYAPWLETILENSSDQEGFYPQRVRARQWLDRLICSRARPMSYIYDIMTPLTPWGPVEAPNYIIQGYLSAGYLLQRDITTEICARRSIAYACDKQVSMTDPDPWPVRAARSRREASRLLKSYRPEMSISSAPSVSIADPTGAGAQALAMLDGSGGVSGILPQQFGSGYSAPVISLYNGTGTGATATGIVVGGLLSGYTITAPGTGFFIKQTPDISFNMGLISWR